MARQLPLHLPPDVRLGAADFFVGAPNRAAYELVTGPAPWPEGKLLVHGPAGAGKSHLARLWLESVGGARIDARRIEDAPRPPDDAAVAVEDLQRLTPDGEVALFHLHNRLRQGGGRLLMTADRPAARLAVALPDLASRLQGTLAAGIGDPDEMLTLALLAKLFSDRGLAPAPGVLSYLAARIGRSHAAAAEAVAALDAASLARKSAVTVPLARAWLSGDLDSGGPGAR
ncbi:HdaA/DnaA family protein [Wenxinia saemankumensis]|uniref:DnaA protein n=1 Tax=Wenxinia saemankumensis TaxID=1447782 RepID=A0A1M6APL6_9RHOB|nr:DnaA/Hda family protein [Wenxinia saemankumensis]SHI38426.1 dnaA protein [Wenxinia saemankumensis]